ncbi:hypothetical protein [Solimonas soli]|uniref:hypothetical protein n=1 Tax=Solimonas soli TaxID=413479 RepID=UPI0012FC3BF3|nr:hypothetical protein [Solimonas soli]
MRKLLFVLVAVSAAQAVQAGEWVDGYTRKDGTYVQGHYRASPDQYRYNNPSSQSMGGTQRDEFSSRPQYNKSNPSYNPYLDRNGNGTYDYNDPYR